MVGAEYITLPIRLPTQLSAFCSEHGVSLTRMLQLTWGAVLRTDTGSNDISFLWIAEASRVAEGDRDQHIFRINVVQDTPILELLQGDAKSWHHEGIGSKIEICETVLLWSIGPTELSDAMKRFPTLEGRTFITIEMGCGDEALAANLLYSRTSIGDSNAKGMAATTRHVAMAIAERPSATLAELELCREEDLQIIQRWNNVEQVWRDEQKLAVSAWDGEVSYGKLNRLSSALAAHLTSLEVEPDQFVAIRSEKSKWLIVSILGVIKAGGAYVVFEPAYTPPRMRSICDELQITLLVSSESMAATARSISKRVVTLAPDSEFLRSDGSGTAMRSLGSTGKPKGIIVEHGGFANWCIGAVDSIFLNGQSRVLQLASFGFLVGHRDILLTLMYRGCICVSSESDRLSHLETFMMEHHVNWANLTPLNVWSGRPDFNLIYGFGQAECVSFSCVRTNPTVDEDRRNLGRRVGKVVWLVDPLDRNKLVPVGAIGEVIIEGRSIAWGYIDRERTELAFLRETTWLHKVRPSGYKTRMFKTGDLARYNEDGSVRFVCRKDNAVKIHGQRMELDEVEQHVRLCMPTIARTEGIHDITVDIASLNDKFMLTVFLGFNHISTESQEDIIVGPLDQATFYLNKLAARLEGKNIPRHHIPTLLIPMSRIPLNPSGKTDRKRLRQIVTGLTPDEAAKFTGPGEDGNEAVEVVQTEEEISLQKLWSQVLNFDASSIGRNHNFFRRGGSSLTAMKLAALTQESGLVLSFKEIFLHQTLAAQAQLVSDRSKGAKQISYSVETFGLIVGEGEEKLQELFKLCATECSLSTSQIEDIYPTTLMQAGLIALTTLLPGSYISQRALEVKGDGKTIQVVVRGQFDFQILDQEQDQMQEPSMQVGRPLARMIVTRGKQGQPKIQQLNAAHHGKPLPQRPFSPLVDYVLQSSKDAKNHWTTEFSGLEAETFPPLPTSTYSPTATRSEQLKIGLPRAAVRKSNHGFTLANKIQLAWAVAIAQYTASHEVVYGLTVSGRGAPVPGIDKVAGPTIATIPLRMQLRPTVTIQDALRVLQDRLIAMGPFEPYGLQNISRLGDEAERACRSQSLVVIQQSSQQNDEHGIIRSRDPGKTGLTLDTYALKLICTPNSAETSVNLEALPQDFEQLCEWNGPVPWPSPDSIVEMTKKHGVKQPEATAVDAWDGSFSYAELDERSSALAVTLAEHGAGRETFVPLCLEKSRYVAVAILAVAKAGGAFILLDPAHPAQRLRSICEDSGSKIIVCSQTQIDIPGQLGCGRIILVNQLHKQQTAELLDHGTAGSLQAGSIFEHAALATNVTLLGPRFRLDNTARVLQFASHSFDAAVADYVFTLAWGGCVCVPNEAASRDDLTKTMDELNVNWACLTPSVANPLDPKGIPRMRSLVLGGEASKQVDVDRWVKGGHGLMHSYGPSECCIYTTLQTTFSNGSNPSNVGRGVAAACWLVNPNDLEQLAPIGVVGELLIEGPIVARGYIGHRPESENFIPFPKRLRRMRPRVAGKGKLYKTGDLARYSLSNDGSLEIIGRKDQQIKLRGQRIELGEIEYQIAQCLWTTADIVAEIITPSHLKTPILVAFRGTTSWVRQRMQNQVCFQCQTADPGLE
ncbi:non-ribosomal peptide synthetase [Aspergillus ustus]|uniref:Non-ribosomal peptide synthetase n=1 Tax=Aspergillus ustus TaxID=40382 RepID=A0A0C1BWI1_ASPUT|nr:non-ribosomal peptide synthetase [Aspergillus ustus]